jgi:hypothetical protein
MLNGNMIMLNSRTVANVVFTELYCRLNLADGLYRWSFWVVSSFVVRAMLVLCVVLFPDACHTFDA